MGKEIATELNFSENMINEVINDPATQDLMKKAIQKSICDSIEHSFQRYGDLNKALEDKVNKILIPYIEKYDITTMIPKLDTVLTDIINATALADNKKILENFKHLMIEPAGETISLNDVFDKYCEFMANNVDTSELEVDYDDGPHYREFQCTCECENSTPEWSHTERWDITFGSEAKIKYREDANFVISLRRWESNAKGQYDILFDKETTVNSLRYMNDFEVFLLKLARAGVKITHVEDMEEYVRAEEEPEPTFV